MAESYVRVEFELQAVFRNAETDAVVATFDDIVGMSGTYGLNTIPMASLIVPCGYSVATDEPATIHSALNVIKPRDKVTVTVKVTANDGDQSKIDSGTFVVFEGYYSGTGYKRSRDNVNYVLHLVHWLDDLNASSMINANWNPGVPHDLAQAANFDLGIVRGPLNNQGIALASNGSGTNMVPTIDRGGRIINAENLAGTEGDLWGKVLLPLFNDIATFQLPSTQNSARSTDGPTNNVTALAALARMPGVAPVPAVCRLDLGDIDPYGVESGVVSGLNLFVKNNMAYSSFWSKLVGEIGPSFFLAVSPSAEFANVVPLFGGLRGEVWRTITGDEYDYADFNSNVSSLIESIEIRYPHRSSSNAAVNGGRSDSISYYYAWGIYPPAEKLTSMRGQIIVKDPPNWLAGLIPTSAYASQTCGLGKRGGDQSSPGTGPGPQPNTPSPAEITRKTSNILDRFCEHWYKTEVLAQRYGELSGKLRFDIAPGSTICIEPPDLKTGSETKMYGLVTHVSFVINAEQHTAGTSFTLTNLRNSVEQDTELFTSDKPPLYQKGWAGGPLVKEITK
jgi:hypothetical protein